MLYLIYGLEKYLIDKEIKRILAENSIEKINVSNYNLEENNLKDIIEDAQTISMFGEKKAIIVDNCFIFTGKSLKNDINSDLLLEYFKSYNPSTVLIFNVIYEKLDERKKVVKEIRNVGTVKDFNKNSDLNSIVKDMFDDYNVKEVIKVESAPIDDIDIARIEELKNIGEKNIDKAIEILRNAKKMHDELEAYYIDAMDFNAMEDIKKEVIDKIDKPVV